jgi:hypothetical protein
MMPLSTLIMAAGCCSRTSTRGRLGYAMQAGGVGWTMRSGECWEVCRGVLWDLVPAFEFEDHIRRAPKELSAYDNNAKYM